jgi:1,4-alpha-glucan branching enzyme
VQFRAWAPAHRRLYVEITGRAPVPMAGPHNGWFEVLMPEARVGDRYRFVLEDGS